MKHVFCIQSNLTYLSSLAVIEKEKLNPNKIIFLTFRGFKPPSNKFTTYNLKQLWQKHETTNFFYLKSTITWLLWFLYIFKLNQLQVYVPNSKIYPCFLFSKVSRVKKYYYIDEGLLFYTNSSLKFGGQRSKLTFPKFAIELIKGIKANSSYFLPDADGTYVFSDKANKDLINKKFINIPTVNSELGTNIKHKTLLLVIDGFVPLNFIKSKDYKYILQKIAEFVNKNFHKTKLYYKIHPAYYYNQYEKQLLKKNIKYFFKTNNCEELPEKIILETLVKESNITMITGFSSIGFFCYLANSSYYSYLNLYLNQNLLENKIFSLPPDYLRYSTKSAGIKITI